MEVKGSIYNIQRMSVQDGPGIRTTIFFKGCPLRCQWCSNPESQQFYPQLMVFEDLCSRCGHCETVCPHDAIIRTTTNRFNRDSTLCANCGACVPGCPVNARAISGKTYTVEDVMDIIRKDGTFYRNSGGGVTCGGGECTAQDEFLCALLAACRTEGLHTCVDTCGYCAPDIFQRIIPLGDLFLYDLKHMDPVQHKQLTGVDNALILKNAQSLFAADPRKIRIRMPLMPGLNDSEENIAAMADFLHAQGCMEIDVMPCHSFGRSKYLALNRQVPDVQEYDAQGLVEVSERFRRHALEPSIV